MWFNHLPFIKDFIHHLNKFYFGMLQAIISHWWTVWLFKQTWILLHQMMLCAKFGWIGPVVLEKKILKKCLQWFYYFAIIPPWRRAWPFIWTNLNPIHPRILYAKFRRNWLRSSGGKDFKKVFTWIPLTHGCFVQCLVEFGPVVLEKKIF